MTSPMKGIERLSEELRLERQKANHAIQDRAKCKNELEALKQSMEIQRVDYQELLQHFEELKLNYSSLQSQYSELDHLRHEQDDTLSALSKEREELMHQITMSNHEKDTLQHEVIMLKEEISKSQVLSDTQVKKLQSKDELIQHLKEELMNIRALQMNNEQVKLSQSEQLSYSVAMNEELQTKLSMVDAIETGYQQTKLSNEELRQELDKSISLNVSYNEQIRDLNTRLADKSSIERSLNDQIKVLISERDEYSILIKELDRNVDELTQQLQTESETRQALQEKAEFAVQNRCLLDEQLHNIRQKYEEMKEEHLVLIENELQYKRQLTLLEEENHTLLLKVNEMEMMKEEMKTMQSLTIEIENLRSQLNHMRKRLIQRDLEDEAGVMTPQAIIDREQQGRQVYEGIIQDLRLEIDRMNMKYHELQRKYDEMMMKSGRVDQLEEEIEMYKEMVKNLTAESQTVALTASEVADRQVKTSHERQNLLQEIYRKDTELESVKGEVQRQREELVSVREKLKTFHNQKLAADKRSTELLAANSKLEASLEDFRQQYDKMVIEQEKARRILQDQSQQIAISHTLQDDLHTLRQERDSLLQQLHEHRLQSQSSEKQHSLQHDSLQVKLANMQEENDELRSTVRALQETCERLDHEYKQAKREVEEMIIDRDHYKNELSLQESKHAEAKLHDLKQELQQTMSDWQLMEEEKKNKEQVLSQITVEYNREKEKNVLQKMQLSLLEERVKVLTQELNVFRNLDVYHASMQQELDAYRSTGGGRGGAAGRATGGERAGTTGETATAGSSMIGRLGPYGTSRYTPGASSSLPLPPHMMTTTSTPSNITNNRTQARTMAIANAANVHASTVAAATAIGATRSLSRSRSHSNVSPVNVNLDVQQEEKEERDGKRLSLDDFHSSFSPVPPPTVTISTTAATAKRGGASTHMTVPVATLHLPRGSHVTPPPPPYEDGDEHGDDDNDSQSPVFTLQEMTIEEKEREKEKTREKVRNKQFQREQEEREREMKERAQRKAQREEQLRQLVLSQEKDRLRLSQSTRGTTPSSYMYGTNTNTNAPLTPLYAATEGRNGGSGDRHHSSGDEGSSHGSNVSTHSNQSGSGAATTTAANKNALRASRFNMDMEKARRLLSM